MTMKQRLQNINDRVSQILAEELKDHMEDYKKLTKDEQEQVDWAINERLQGALSAIRVTIGKIKSEPKELPKLRVRNNWVPKPDGYEEI